MAVECSDCGLTTIGFMSEGRAAEAWNTRVAPGRGTCELVTSGTPCEGNADVECTRCGAYNIPQGGYYDHEGRRRETFAHCPNCGAEVRKAVSA